MDRIHGNVNQVWKLRHGKTLLYCRYKFEHESFGNKNLQPKETRECYFLMY